MTQKIFRFAAGAVLAVAGAAAFAAPPPKMTFTPLGLPGAIPISITDDGNKIVGAGFFGGGYFTYTAAEGIVLIGGGCDAGQPAISGDGSTIVGCTFDENGIGVAAKWLGGTDWQPMGSVPGGVPCDRSLSSIWDVDYDGSTAVGLAWLPQLCRAHAGSWDVPAGGPATDLGSTVPNSASRANAISGDGQIIAGWQDNEVGRTGARWVGGVEEPVLTDAGEYVGEVAVVNFDGSVMAGEGIPYGTLNAWVWTARRGFTVIAPPSPTAWTTMYANGASDDGSIAVGFVGNFQTGIRRGWVFSKGKFTYLRDYLTKKNLAPGWSIDVVTGISPDGTTLFGWGINPSGEQEGFVIENYK